MKNSEHGSLFFVALTVCLAVLLLSSCQPSDGESRQAVFSGPIMGTEYRVTVVSRESLELKSLEQDVIAAMESVNQSMSNYLDDSELSEFNASNAGEEMRISEDFRTVMEESLQLSELSAGAFDVTLGNAVNAWGFGPDGRIVKQPSAETLLALRASVGHQKLTLDGRNLSKSHDAVNVDLSAIAKGYAIDKVAELLTEQGVDRFLINIGGELRASGYSLDEQLWKVGIEKPHVLGGIQEIATLDNQAIATSGDYRNFHIIDGLNFSHTIDPQTLKPVLHKLASASVISAKASTADALATALMAMGEARAIEFVEQHQLAAYLVMRDGAEGEYKTYVTQKFRSNLQ